MKGSCLRGLWPVEGSCAGVRIRDINSHALRFRCEEKRKKRRWSECVGSAVIFPALFLTLDEYRSVRGEGWEP